MLLFRVCELSQGAWLAPRQREIIEKESDGEGRPEK